MSYDGLFGGPPRDRTWNRRIIQFRDSAEFFNIRFAYHFEFKWKVSPLGSVSFCFIAFHLYKKILLRKIEVWIISPDAIPFIWEPPLISFNLNTVFDTIFVILKFPISLKLDSILLYLFNSSSVRCSIRLRMIDNCRFHCIAMFLSTEWISKSCLSISCRCLGQFLSRGIRYLGFIKTAFCCLNELIASFPPRHSIDINSIRVLRAHPFMILMRIRVFAFLGTVLTYKQDLPPMRQTYRIYRGP